MWIILDLLVAAIVIIYIFVSAKRGFVKTVIEVVGFCLALYISFTASGLVANGIYDNVVKPSLVKSTVSSVNEKVSSGADATVQTIWDALPVTVSNAAKNFGFTPQTVSDSVNEKLSSNAGVENAVSETVDTVARPVVVPLIKTVSGLIIFLVLMILVKILSHALGKIAALPIIGQINMFLGGILGLLKGLIIAAILCIIISTAVELTSNGFWIFTKENISASYLFSFLAKFNPFYK